MNSAALNLGSQTTADTCADNATSLAAPESLLQRRAQAGDVAARESLLLQHQDAWYRFCFAQLNNTDAAREATQETALRFLECLPSFRGQSELLTWSLGIALNVCRESQRRARRTLPDRLKPSTASEARGNAEVAMIGQEDSHKLHLLLAALSPRQRQAVVLRYFEEMSVDGVARAMGCATGTVKATLAQALRALRQRWEPKP